MGTCSLRRWPPEPPLCAHPRSSPSGGRAGHILWSELHQPSGQACTDGDTEAQRGPCQGRVLHVDSQTRADVKGVAWGSSGQQHWDGVTCLQVLPPTGALRCLRQPPPSKQDARGLRVPGEDPGHADALSVSEKAEGLALLSPPARPGSFPGARPLNASPSTWPTETGLAEGQAGTGSVRWSRLSVVHGLRGEG